MAIRIYTNGPDDNILVKNLLYKSVLEASTMPYLDYPWQFLLSPQADALTSPRPEP